MLKMAEISRSIVMEKEKDNFWLYIGLLIAAVVVGVFILKGREMESVPYQAYSETKAEVEKQMQNAKP
jgi:hypothetical protein